MSGIHCGRTLQFEALPIDLMKFDTRLYRGTRCDTEKTNEEITITK